MTTLTGHDAIEYAESHGLKLNKYTDPTEGAREGLSVDEARKVASEDPELIYVTATRGECIRHGSFGPIVWDNATGETRMAAQNDMDSLPVGDDLTAEEEAAIPEE